MHQSSNNPHAFPLPACTAHTFQWEDGEHDTCYRCGADRPGIESVSDDELVAECRRRGLPGTVTELVQEAERQGVEPSALLERLDGSYDFAKAASILTEEGLL